MMESALFQFLSAIKPINIADWELFQSCGSEQKLPKQALLLAEGKVCTDLFFIIKGSIRAYHLKDGNELNTAFFMENNFATDFESLSSGKASQVFIETMEPVHIISINRSKLLSLYQEAPILESIGRIILERILSQQQLYSKLFTLYSPAERYTYITENHPELLQRIPLQFLASYLGIARETLSRIRKRTG